MKVAATYLAVVIGGLGVGVSIAQPQRCDERKVALAIIEQARPAMGSIEKQFWLDAISAAAQKHKLPLAIVVSKVVQESKLNGRAVSEAGAKGASQLMPMWVKGFDPFEIEANLDKGAEVLAAELQAVGGDIYRALRRYNGGPSVESAPQSSLGALRTKAYANEILARVYIAQLAVCRGG